MTFIQTKGWSWGTRICSIILLAGFAGVTFGLSTYWRLGFLLLISTPLGCLAAWKRFSFGQAFRATLLSIDFTELMHIFVVIAVSTLIISPIAAYSSKSDLHPLFFSSARFALRTYPVSLSDAFGALLFGIGMFLSSGCVFGTVIGMGQGVVKSWIVALGAVVGGALGACKPVWSELSGWPNTKASVEWWAILLIELAFIAALIIAYFVKDRVIGKGTPGLDSLTVGLDYSEADLSAEKNLKDWKRYAVDVGVGGLLALYFGCTGEPLPMHSVLYTLGGQFYKVCGGSIVGWRGYSMGNVLDYPGFISLIFILLGSFAVTSWTSTVGRAQLNSPKELISGCIGGIIMGFGGAVSSGCTIDGVVANFQGGSVAPIVWILCALLGAGIVVITEKVWKWRELIRKRSNTLTSIFKSLG